MIRGGGQRDTKWELQNKNRRKENLFRNWSNLFNRKDSYQVS